MTPTNIMITKVSYPLSIYEMLKKVGAISLWNFLKFVLTVLFCVYRASAQMRSYWSKCSPRALTEICTISRRLTKNVSLFFSEMLGRRSFSHVHWNKNVVILINLYNWLHRKLLKWKLSVQPVTKKSSKWQCVIFLFTIDGFKGKVVFPLQTQIY